MNSVAASASEWTNRILDRIHSPALVTTRWVVFAGAVLLVGTAAWLARGAPGWVMMWSVAAAQWVALKLAMLRGNWRGGNGWRIAAFLLLWPGMNAARFLRYEHDSCAKTGVSERERMVETSKHGSRAHPLAHARSYETIFAA